MTQLEEIQMLHDIADKGMAAWAVNVLVERDQQRIRNMETVMRELHAERKRAVEIAEANGSAKKKLELIKDLMEDDGK